MDQKKLIQLINSIRQFYNNRIIILDDGKLFLSDDDIKDFENIKYIKTEYDIGLSEGRNRLIEQVSTKYFLLLDDDFLFTKDTNINKMYQTIVNNNFDIVGGDVWDFKYKNWISKYPKRGIKRNFSGVLSKNDKELELIMKPKNIENEFEMYDIILNFFIAKTDLIKKVKWNPKLKILEHIEFFWRLKEFNPKITTVDVPIYNMVKKSNHEYYKLRRGRKNTFIKILYKELEVEKISVINNDKKYISG
ncbi:MAG: hypothetical protein CMF62_02475 [Magnetococcales bacterium]|nr:hypothetical protein [Magnetococcales bacterium]